MDYAEDERAAHRDLKEYTTLRIGGATASGERYATEFVLKLLKKRLFSSPAAFATTLAQCRSVKGFRLLTSRRLCSQQEARRWPIRPQDCPPECGSLTSSVWVS